MSSEESYQILLRDLDPDFLEALAKAAAWEYSGLFERLSENRSLPDDYREEQFNRSRGETISNTIARVARQHGVPFEFRRLSCNGQHKLLVKAGRVILIQEPILSSSDHPQPADYKRELAETHGIVRQLELDLRDQPLRITDWSGCLLCVILHGAAGPKFTREHKELGNIMLGVPDAAYQQWVLRMDLHRVAMFGRDDDRPESTDMKDAGRPTQEDKVVVSRKKKNSVKDRA